MSTSLNCGVERLWLAGVSAPPAVCRPKLGVGAGASRVPAAAAAATSKLNRRLLVRRVPPAPESDDLPGVRASDGVGALVTLIGGCSADMRCDDADVLDARFACAGDRANRSDDGLSVGKNARGLRDDRGGSADAAAAVDGEPAGEKEEACGVRRA